MRPRRVWCPAEHIETLKAFDHDLQESRSENGDENGNLDGTLQITLNGTTFIPADQHHTPLNEGDTVTFMLVMAD